MCVSTLSSDVCKDCQHVVATHHYTFSTIGDFQVRGTTFYSVTAE